MRNKINDMTWAVSYNQHATLGYFKIDMIITKIVTGDIFIFLNRHATLGPPVEAPNIELGFQPLSS